MYEDKMNDLEYWINISPEKDSLMDELRDLLTDFKDRVMDTIEERE